MSGPSAPYQQASAVASSSSTSIASTHSTVSSSSANSLPESFITAAFHQPTSAAAAAAAAAAARGQHPQHATAAASPPFQYATPTNQWPPPRIALHPPDQPPSFTLVCLGVGGGPLESDCSCYLLKPADQAWEESGAIVLEGGSWLGALIRVCEPSGPDSPFFDIDFPFEDPALRAGLVGSFAKSFLISHAHLDHILGLVLGSASLPGKRTVLGLKPTLDNIMDLFNGKIWPKLASWKEDEPHTVYHMKALEQRTATGLLSNSLSVLPFALSHGLNPSVPPAPPTPTSVYTSTLGSFSAAFSSTASSSAAAAAAAANASYLSKRYSLPLSSLSLNMGIMGLPGAPGGSHPSPLAAQRFIGGHPAIGLPLSAGAGNVSSGSSTSSEFLIQQQQLQHHSGSLYLPSFSIERPIFTSPFAPDPAKQLERNSAANSSGPGLSGNGNSNNGPPSATQLGTSPLTQSITTPTPTDTRNNVDPFSSAEAPPYLGPKSASIAAPGRSWLTPGASTPTNEGVQTKTGKDVLSYGDKDGTGTDVSGLGLTTGATRTQESTPAVSDEAQRSMPLPPSSAAAAVAAATTTSSTNSATPGILGRTTLGRTKAPRRPRTAQGSERVGGSGARGASPSTASRENRLGQTSQQQTPGSGPSKAEQNRANSRRVSVDRSPPALDSTAFFITNTRTGKDVLFFGDVEPDCVSRSPRNKPVWTYAASKFVEGKLSAVFLECSFPASHPTEFLYGHLSVNHLYDELRVLAKCVLSERRRRASVAENIARRAAAAAAGHTSATFPASISGYFGQTSGGGSAATTPLTPGSLPPIPDSPRDPAALKELEAEGQGHQTSRGSHRAGTRRAAASSGADSKDEKSTPTLPQHGTPTPGATPTSEDADLQQILRGLSVIIIHVKTALFPSYAQPQTPQASVSHSNLGAENGSSAGHRGSGGPSSNNPFTGGSGSKSESVDEGPSISSASTIPANVVAAGGKGVVGRRSLEDTHVGTTAGAASRSSSTSSMMISPSPTGGLGSMADLSLASTSSLPGDAERRRSNASVRSNASSSIGGLGTASTDRLSVGHLSASSSIASSSLAGMGGPGSGRRHSHQALSTFAEEKKEAQAAAAATAAAATAAAATTILDPRTMQERIMEELRDLEAQCRLGVRFELAQQGLRIEC